MIVGKGLIAAQFQESDFSFENCIILASGVSDSSESRECQFQREITLVKQHCENKLPVVYFSTISIYDQSKHQSAYVQHKKNMEELIKTHASRYLILRLPNLIGTGGNPKNFVNFISRKIKSREEITCHTYARRYFLDASLLPHIVNDFLLLKESITVDICPRKSYLVKDVIKVMSNILGIGVCIVEIDEGHSYNVDSSHFYNVANAKLAFEVNRPLKEILERVLS